MHGVRFTPQHETLIYSTYYAPRGRQRLYFLASELSQRYLYPDDLLIGIIGSEGAGKSTLIKGLFPGLELTNDDDGVNVRPAPLYNFDPGDYFAPHTFHIDIRYELAFKQAHQVAGAISLAVQHGRRVVVEHFDLICDTLKYGAHVLFGIGEEVIVARPSVFGPFPAEVKQVVDRTIRYRRMAHTAEDLTAYILQRDCNYTRRLQHSDVKHGFVMNFEQMPEFDIAGVEGKVREIIAQNLPVTPVGEDTIRIGDIRLTCTGIRTHVKATAEIENFRLLPQLKFNALTGEYLLVGMVGDSGPAGAEGFGSMLGFAESR